MSRLLATLVLATGSLVAGCASFHQLSSEVSTFGAWPAERKPASYAFERLPSQRDDPSKRQQLLEDAAGGALQQAGFVAATDPKAAEYLVQVGARVWSDDPWIYNGPLFWHGDGPWGYVGWGRGAWRGGGWAGPGWGGWGPGWGPGWGGWGPYQPRFDREVAVVIRDRQSGQALYESHASNSGPSPAIDTLLPAMFAAALKDFPAIDSKPRQVTVEFSRNPG